MRFPMIFREPSIWWVIAGTTLIRLAFAATTGLGIDESYMVTAGRELSLGYFDHPPASWWLSWGASHLFATEAPWAVRLPFILLFALSQILIWRITCLIAGRRAAFWAVVVLNLSPEFSVTTGSWVLPDGPMDAALLGATLCLLNALSSATSRRAWIWWAATGLCAGLALFSKYSAILTIGGAFMYLVMSRQHRHWLTRFEFYVAIVLAATVFSPVLIWNATHGWASFAFQGDRAVGLRFQPLMPIQTLAGEALFVLPWIWVPMMILFAGEFRRHTSGPERVLVWLAAPPIVFFALISAWTNQRVLYHWAAPGYLMLFPLVGQAIALRQDSKLVRNLVGGTIALLLASLTIIVTQVQFDWLGSSLSVVLHTDPTAEGIDWTSLRDELLDRGLIPPGTVVATSNWRDAGKIGHALGPSFTMLCLCKDARQFAFAAPPRQFSNREVLLLVSGSAENASEEAKRWFEASETLPAATVRINGRVLRIITVIRGHRLLT